MTKDGKELQSFGSARGNTSTQLNYPWYLAIDHITDECLIADRNNYRVLHLGADLRPTGVVIDSPQGPSRLCLAGDVLLVAQANNVNVFNLRS